MGKGIMAGAGIAYPSSLDALRSDVLEGFSYIGSDKKKLEGSIPSIGATTHTPGASDIVLNSGFYLSGAQVIKGDPNLIPANIRKGVTIFGVAGSYVPTKIITLGASTINSIWADAPAGASVELSWMAGTGYPYFHNPDYDNAAFIANFTLNERINLSDYSSMIIRGNQNSGYSVFASNIGSTAIRVSDTGTGYQDISSQTGRGTASSDGHSITFNLSNVTGLKYLYISLYMSPGQTSYSWLSSVEFYQ